MFVPFGVSEPQFGYLVQRGARYRGEPGTVVVRGGTPNGNILLMLRGTVVATCRAPTDASAEEGAVVCKYVGKLDAAQKPVGEADAEAEHDATLPTRGSLIGGSSIVDRDILTKPYPNDLVAETTVEWIEWEHQELVDILSAHPFRSVQAAFFATLYVEILESTRAFNIQARDDVAPNNQVSAPTAQQLSALGFFVAVPFFGFGFADNFIMILCGDFIDAQFGVKFGLTTLAAAGVGNWVSDVVGLSLGDVIERTAHRMGLSNGGLTKRQEGLQMAKLVTLAARVIGISLGCFAGMVPLLWLTPNRVEFALEDIEIFDEIFAPSGVSTHAFSDLMACSEKRHAKEGTVLIKEGQCCSKVYLILHGRVEKRKPNGDALAMYSGRLDSAGGHTDHLNDIKQRGSIVGGSAIANREQVGRPYPTNVVAITDIEWLEWEIADLCQIMAAEKAIQASFYSILYGEILDTLKVNERKQGRKYYQSMLMTVISDGVVHQNERRLIEDYQSRLGIGAEDHVAMLAELGWSKADWDAGSQTVAEALSLAESIAELDKAMHIIREVADSMKHEHA